MEQFSSANGLTPNEIKMISARDSFYVASIGDNGFPYIQHRGGPAGFLKVLDPKTLGFIDFSGNKQYITVGDIQNHDKVALIMVDYPKRERLKIYAMAEIVALGDRPGLKERLDLQGYKARPERIILYHIEAFDWNCPQHITPRYTALQLQEVMQSHAEYVGQLESEVASLREMLRRK